jgi:hypothetical protein
LDHSDRQVALCAGSRTSSDSAPDRGATNRRVLAWTTHRRRLCLGQACRRPRGLDPGAGTLCIRSSASCSLTRVRPLAAPDHIPFMKRAGKPWVFSALIPEQRLWLHWLEAQETFLVNAKRSWGDQFFAHSPLDLLPPPHLLFSLFGVNCRDSGSCSYCYKAARHHSSSSPVFFGHRLCRVAIVVPLNNESAFLLIYCPVFFASSSSYTAARLGSSRPLLLQQLFFLSPSATYRRVIKFSHAPTSTSQELQAVLQLFQTTHSL